MTFFGATPHRSLWKGAPRIDHPGAMHHSSLQKKGSQSFRPGAAAGNDRQQHIEKWKDENNKTTKQQLRSIPCLFCKSCLVLLQILSDAGKESIQTKTMAMQLRKNMKKQRYTLRLKWVVTWGPRCFRLSTKEMQLNLISCQIRCKYRLFQIYGRAVCAPCFSFSKNKVLETDVLQLAPLMRCDWLWMVQLKRNPQIWAGESWWILMHSTFDLSLLIITFQDLSSWSQQLDLSQRLSHRTARMAVFSFRAWFSGTKVICSVFVWPSLKKVKHGSWSRRD